MQTLREIGRALLVLLSWTSMALGFILALPFVLLMAAIMIIFPFQMFMIWWGDMTMNASINHACDWWLNPLLEVTKGHFVMSFLYVVLYFVSMISFFIFHALLKR